MDKYKRYRYPVEIISYAVWCYYRFIMSYRDVEELLLARGIVVSYETLRQWSNKFGVEYANKIKKRSPKRGDKWHIDEMCITFNKKRYWLFRAVDQNGYELDILLQPRRDKKSVTRFFKKVLRGCQYVPRVVVTDKLRSYNQPIKTLLPNTDHRKHKRLNNRVENAHQPSRKRSMQMVKFKDPPSANRFLAVHGQVRNLFNVGRYSNTANVRRIKLKTALENWQSIASQVKCA